MKKNMTKSEMRVAIAMDAIEQIKAGKWIPKSGCYIGFDAPELINKKTLQEATCP